MTIGLWIFRKGSLYLLAFEKLFLCVLLFSMAFLSFSQVLARNIFSSGFMWIDEILRVEVLWITFVGASLAAEYGQHIKIDLLTNLAISDSLKKTVKTGALFFMMVISFVFFIVAVDYIRIISSDSTSNILKGIPDWVFGLVIPYSFLMISFRSFTRILKVFGDPKPEIVLDAGDLN